jgi:hypothetical protein
MNPNPPEVDCLKCEKRDGCIKLCPKARKRYMLDEGEWHEEAEDYSYHNGVELRLFRMKIGRERSFLTVKEKEILHALGGGLTRVETSEKLGMSSTLLRKHLSNMRIKAREHHLG